MEDISNIQRILLNIKYDSKRTLTENKKLILEYLTATVDTTNQTLKLDADTDCEKGGTNTTGTEIRLIKGSTFKKIGNYLVTKNQTVYKVDDYFGSPQGTLTGKTVKINCTPTEGTYNVTIDGESGFWYGENWGYSLNNSVAQACAFKEVTSSSGSGGSPLASGECGAYVREVFGQGDKLNYWETLKKQANLYLWGCKEETSTNKTIPAGMMNKKYKCPSGINFYSYELQNCTELASSTSTDKTFKTETPYIGQAFTNIKDKNGQTLAAFIGANITQTSTSNQKPAATGNAKPAAAVEAKPCSGTFKQGCKDGGGDTTISKVQKCLLDKGMYKTSSGKPARVDGDFGPGTLAGIKQLLGKDTFTAEEVDTKICGPGAQTPPGVSSGGGGQDTGTQTSDDRETVGGQ